MEQHKKDPEPDHTAVRTALWRALHLKVDSEPYLIEDEIGLRLIAPSEQWQQRPDMHPTFTKRLRASILARARFIDDLLIEQSNQGVHQYIILGAGLDSFAQRRPDIASKIQIYEIDQPDTQIWKQKRLMELGFGIPKWLHFVPVNFETSSWWEELLKAGFDSHKPALITCTGVTLYLTKEAIEAMLAQITKLAPGSKLAITFYLPLELMDEEDKALQLIAEKGAKAAGTPFISFFTPEQLLKLAHETGLKNIETVSSSNLAQRYFSNRTDHLSPATGEDFLIATI
jgi:methyltransferase (TIGR00027 family)